MAASTVEPTTAVEATAATMKPAAAVESFTSVESSTSMEATAAVKSSVATTESAAIKSASEATSVKSTAAYEAASPVKTPSFKPAAKESWAPVKAMKPRAGADKHSAQKVIWAIVAIGGAIVRIISVIAVSAHGRGTDITWANSDRNCNLRTGRSRCGQRAK